MRPGRAKLLVWAAWWCCEHHSCTKHRERPKRRKPNPGMSEGNDGAAIGALSADSEQWHITHDPDRMPYTVEPTQQATLESNRCDHFMRCRREHRPQVHDADER